MAKQFHVKIKRGKNHFEGLIHDDEGLEIVKSEKTTPKNYLLKRSSLLEEIARVMRQFKVDSINVTDVFVAPKPKKKK